jgi:hypothetical protein
MSGQKFNLIFPYGMVFAKAMKEQDGLLALALVKKSKLVYSVIVMLRG